MILEKVKKRRIIFTLLFGVFSLHALTFFDVGVSRSLSSIKNPNESFAINSVSSTIRKKLKFDTQAEKASRGDHALKAREANGLFIPPRPDSLPLEIISSTTKNLRNHFLSDCVPTSQFRIEDKVPKNKGYILLHSLGPDGKRKTKGGDEIYVTYFDNSNDSLSPNAVANVEDLENGIYELRFFRSRSPTLARDRKLDGVGRFKINLHYTCFAGHLDPPHKNSWINSGVINTRYSSQNNIRPPPIRDPPNSKTYPELANYETVYGIGNSMMRQLFGHIAPRKSNFKYPDAVAAPLNTQTVYEMLNRVRDIVKIDTKEHNGKPSTNSALVLGSCVWDVLSIHSKQSFDGKNRGGFYELKDHLDAIEIYIKTIKKEFPKWSLYWKGCTAIQVHAAEVEGLLDRYCMYYASWIRGKTLDLYQKKLMKALDIPVLDLWDISFQMDEWMQFDGRHYNSGFNRIAMNHFLGISNALTF